MFTGIVTEIGTVQSKKPSESGQTFTVKCENVLKNKKIGESIAVNGACMTITELGEDYFCFDCIPESLKLTNLTSVTEVNLEAAMTLNQGIDGHLVQGHIDCTGTVSDFAENRLTIKFPQEISLYLSLKGSITVNGVSLTISGLTTDTFSVSLIPETLKNTNLGQAQKEDKLNLEVDLIARYLKRMLDNKETNSN
ncbi:riboflavin synthase [Candidatus Gracilibacteria bacterium]|nr:riboflavin synthase [Candidatus Gracilibacteria bacterium]